MNPSGGLGNDAQWNDDFHHALHVSLTGERFGYYVDYEGPSDLARAINEGFVLQGDYSTFRGRHHGAPSGSIPPERFVVFAQNHDHVGNRPLGERLVTLVGVERETVQVQDLEDFRLVVVFSHAGALHSHATLDESWRFSVRI